jgi:ElaB/YqjD/DUF883 family membrane-anchored ribosome-binding protein
MAQHKRANRASTSTTGRKRATSTSRRRRMTRRARARRPQSLMKGGLLAVRDGMSGDVTAMQDEVRHLASDLQDRLNRLNRISRQGASHASEGVQHFIADTLDSLTSKAVSDLTSGVQERVTDLTDEATRMSNKAIRRVSREIDRRPLLTLAIAAGVGYLAGMAMQHRD